MISTVRSRKKNSNQSKARRRTTCGIGNLEENTKSEGTIDLLETPQISKEPLSEEQEYEKTTTYLREEEEKKDEDIRNTEVTKACLKGDGCQNRLHKMEKIRIYEELYTKRVEEKVQSFQDQIVSAGNKIKKIRALKESGSTSADSSSENEGKPLCKKNVSEAEEKAQIQNYTSAKTLPLGKKIEEELQQKTDESFDLSCKEYNKLYNKTYDSAENIREIDEIFSDTYIDTKLDETTSFKNDSPGKSRRQTERVLIHGSEYGFKIKEKRYVSQMERRSIEHLEFKPLPLDKNKIIQALPAITTQPALQKMQDRRSVRSSPQTEGLMSDKIDCKISKGKEERKMREDDFPLIINVQYKSNCMLECVCCLVQSFI